MLHEGNDDILRAGNFNFHIIGEGTGLILRATPRARHPKRCIVLVEDEDEARPRTEESCEMQATHSDAAAIDGADDNASHATPAVSQTHADVSMPSQGWEEDDLGMPPNHMGLDRALENSYRNDLTLDDGRPEQRNLYLPQQGGVEETKDAAEPTVNRRRLPRKRHSHWKVGYARSTLNQILLPGQDPGWGLFATERLEAD